VPRQCSTSAASSKWLTCLALEKITKVRYYPRSFHGLGSGFPDHNFVIVPYFAADEATTMDAHWRGEESVGKYVLVSSVPFDYADAESLARWNNKEKSIIAQKLVQFIAAGDVLKYISVAAMQRSSGVLMITS
jgi:hypothetical protein